MVFSSLTFLLIFLPTLYCMYFGIHNIKLKNYILLIFSLIFYGWGEPVYIILMILSIIITYISALLLERYKKQNNVKKIIFIISLIILLSSLLFFKYYNFIVININTLFNINITKTNLPLPIGISFYTFQAISYLVDVYMQKTKTQKNL